MSQLESTDRGRLPAAKPKSDIYTVLLGISLVAILLAILCLALELSRYAPDFKAEKAKFRGVTSVPAERMPAEVAGVVRV